METFLINAESNLEIEQILKKAIKEAKSESIAIATTIQHLSKLKQIKHPYIKSIHQIIGCNIGKTPKAEKIIYIGSGKFHPIEIAKQTEKEVIVANPHNNNITKITKQQINLEKTRTRGKLITFHSAEKIGILISTKPGQYNINQATKLQKTIKKPSYLFLFNTLNQNELENFSQIDCWVNTACPRIEGKNIINIKDLPQ